MISWAPLAVEAEADGHGAKSFGGATVDDPNAADDILGLLDHADAVSHGLKGPAEHMRRARRSQRV